MDLNNFDSPEAESSQYVLTSPRSLTSCARLGVRPVQLLIKSLNELIAEQHTAPLEAVKVMHESYETERRRLLHMCRDERQRIIGRGSDRWQVSSRKKVSGLDKVADTRLEEAAGSMGAIPYADLCKPGKPVSRSSCSASELREPDRDTLITLRELRHSPATEAELERLTADITKKMSVRMSEKDRKITAVMLAKHQEEQERLKLCRQEEQQQQEAKRQEEALQAQAEKKRRKRLMQSMQRWQEDLEARRRLRGRQEKERVEQLQQEMLLQEERWRRLKEEVEVQRRQKMVAAQKEAEGRKCCQETLLKLKEEVEKRQREQERQVAVDKEQKARRRKVLQDKKEKKRLQEENRWELLRHILLKQQVEQQGEAEEEKTRNALEKKLQNSWERRSRVVDARLSELQERAAQEEQQIQRAQLRAELQNIQQLLHRRLLVQLSQRRADKAAQNISAQSRNRAQQIRQHNKLRQLLHQRLREKLQREEEAARTLAQSRLLLKEWRREKLWRQRQQLQEEAHRRARASFHIRDRVRQHTHTRNFAQMLLEAQLTASISRMTL